MNANLNLQLYPLPANIVRTLNRASQTAERFAEAGEAVPAVIGLKRDDFATVDAIVRRVSSDRANAKSVTWGRFRLWPVAA